MTEQKIAEIFEQVGLAKIVRELGNNELLNAVQSAMIEIAGHSEIPNNHEGLDDAAKNYALNTAEDSEQYSARYLGYKDGAKWQKEQDDKELSEKIAAAYQLGRSDERKQKPAEKSEIPTNLDDLLDDYFEKLVVPDHQIIFEDTFRKIAKDFYGYGSSEKPNNHAEWSEEDEKMLEDICSHLVAYPDTRARWQKFLRSLRPHWQTQRGADECLVSRAE